MQPRAIIFTGSAACAGAAAIITLAACGGGSSSMAVPPPPSPTPTAAACHQTVMGPAPQQRAVSRFVLRPASRGADASQDVIPGIVGVRFAARDPRLVSSAATLVGGVANASLDANGAATIALPKGADPVRAAAALQSMRGVVAAGPIVRRYAQAAQVIPSDPDFGALPYHVTNPSVSNPPIQWDMYKMNLPSAWALPTGFGSSTVRLAIIDTGYDKTNPDLFPSGRVAMSVVFDKGNGTVDSTANIQDHDGHGTDVSGIAAADTNNATDVAGMAGGITLLEARVFPTPSPGHPNPSASSEDVAAAIDWAVTNGAKVISLSLGSSSPDNTFEEPAVAAAIASGATVVAAAGNGNAQGVGQPTLDFPAADPNVIAVGASALCDGASPRDFATSFEYVASYSNFLPHPTASQYFVVAPGGDPSVMQTQCGTLSCIDFLQWITNLYSKTASQFAGETVLIAGTSQATPHVAGLAALMLSKDGALTTTQIAQIISANTVNINDTRQGHGRVDALAVLNATP